MIHPSDWSFPSAFVDSALADDERTLFEEHLAGCVDCRREVEALRALKTRLAEAPRRSMPPALRARIARRAQPPAWRRWFPAPGRRWILAGATAAALASAAVWVLRPIDAAPAAIDLQPLMIAHAESAAERPLPVGSFYDEDAVRWASYNENDAAP